MSATSQLTTFADLYTDLLNRACADTSSTGNVEQAKRFINIALHDLVIGYAEKMGWNERIWEITTEAPYTTGTVTATNGDSAIVGSGTSWTGVGSGDRLTKMTIGSDNTVYLLRSVTDATNLTLVSDYVGTTGAGLTYRIFQDEYILGGGQLYHTPIDTVFFDDDRTIEMVDRRVFRARYPRNSVPGRPRVATMATWFGGGTDNESSAILEPTVQFHPPPDAQYRFKHHYTTTAVGVSATGVLLTSLSADTDEPMLPLRGRHLVVLGALTHWYRDKKNDNERANSADAHYQSLLGRVIADAPVGTNRAQMAPRQRLYKSAARAPYSRGRGRRYVTGTAFDEIR